MSFREKSAWISFYSIAIFAVMWFTHIARVEFFHVPENPMLWFFGTLVTVLALEIGLQIWIRIQSPHEARTPKDERERLIDMKASRVAFYVLLVGAFSSIGTMHIPGSNRFTMAQTMMGSILVALLTRFATQIVLHRRDA
ncbi:MAG TPA: hypothetical protein VN628_19250 [Vicinamibacterales bacterium]|nr:hypothetical protein [Vicinamibacterales bacterium]